MSDAPSPSGERERQVIETIASAQAAWERHTTLDCLDETVRASFMREAEQLINEHRWLAKVIRVRMHDKSIREAAIEIVQELVWDEEEQDEIDITIVEAIIARTRAPAPPGEREASMNRRLIVAALDRARSAVADLEAALSTREPAEQEQAVQGGVYWIRMLKAPDGEWQYRPFGGPFSMSGVSNAPYDGLPVWPEFVTHGGYRAGVVGWSESQRPFAALSAGEPAEQEPGERDRHGYLPCHRCGADCGMDAVVPDEVWAKISPSGEGGMLCLWCMDAVCVERGIEGPVSVKLYYPGRVLVSASYEPAEQGRADVEARYREALEKIKDSAEGSWNITSGDGHQGCIEIARTALQGSP